MVFWTSKDGAVLIPTCTEPIVKEVIGVEERCWAFSSRLWAIEEDRACQNEYPVHRDLGHNSERLPEVDAHCVYYHREAEKAHDHVDDAVVQVRAHESVRVVLALGMRLRLVLAGLDGYDAEVPAESRRERAGAGAHVALS